MKMITKLPLHRSLVRITLDAGRYLPEAALAQAAVAAKVGDAHSPRP